MTKFYPTIKFYRSHFFPCCFYPEFSTPFSGLNFIIKIFDFFFKFLKISKVLKILCFPKRPLRPLLTYQVVDVVTDDDDDDGVAPPPVESGQGLSSGYQLP